MKQELIEDRIEMHSKILDDHTERIYKLEQSNAEIRVEIKNLCESIKSLTNIIRWELTLLMGSLIGFFLYTIKLHLK